VSVVTYNALLDACVHAAEIPAAAAAAAGLQSPQAALTAAELLLEDAQQVRRSMRRGRGSLRKRRAKCEIN
jgi:hypothetical protein